MATNDGVGMAHFTVVPENDPRASDQCPECGRPVGAADHEH
jgi:ribosomal protein S27AE